MCCGFPCYIIITFTHIYVVVLLFQLNNHINNGLSALDFIKTIHNQSLFTANFSTSPTLFLDIHRYKLTVSLPSVGQEPITSSSILIVIAYPIPTHPTSVVLIRNISCDNVVLSECFCDMLSTLNECEN